MSSTTNEETHPSMAALVAALDTMPAVQVRWSKVGDGDDSDWSVFFTLNEDDEGRITLEAKLCLEFLAWIVVHDMSRKSRRRVTIAPHALPPHLNGPGEQLMFILEGNEEASNGTEGVTADRVADLLNQCMDLYVGADELRSHLN